MLDQDIRDYHVFRLERTTKDSPWARVKAADKPRDGTWSRARSGLLNLAGVHPKIVAKRTLSLYGSFEASRENRLRRSRQYLLSLRDALEEQLASDYVRDLDTDPKAPPVPTPVPTSIPAPLESTGGHATHSELNAVAQGFITATRHGDVKPSNHNARDAADDLRRNDKWLSDHDLLGNNDWLNIHDWLSNHDSPSNHDASKSSPDIDSLPRKPGSTLRPLSAPRPPPHPLRYDCAHGPDHPHPRAAQSPAGIRHFFLRNERFYLIFPWAARSTLDAC